MTNLGSEMYTPKMLRGHANNLLIGKSGDWEYFVLSCLIAWMLSAFIKDSCLEV